VIRENHECNKRYCQNCNENKEVGQPCDMRPLKNVLPACDKELYVFYDFETTKNTNFLLGPRYMFQISFACSSSARCARISKTPGINARNEA